MMQLSRLDRDTFWRFKNLAKDLGKRDTNLLGDLLDLYDANEAIEVVIETPNPPVSIIDVQAELDKYTTPTSEVIDEVEGQDVQVESVGNSATNKKAPKKRVTKKPTGTKTKATKSTK